MGSCLLMRKCFFLLVRTVVEGFFNFCFFDFFFLLFGRYYFSVSIWKLTDDYFGKVEASITPLKGKF